MDGRQCLVETQIADPFPVVIYTAPSYVDLTSFVAHNGSAVFSNLYVALLPSGVDTGTWTANHYVALRTMMAHDTYDFPEVVGHTLNPGGSILVVGGGSGWPTVRVTGVVKP